MIVKKYKGEQIMSLTELRENQEAIISGLEGDSRFMSRITSMGITPGCKIKVIKNDSNRPMLIFARNTMIALNKKECKGVFVKEVMA